MLDCETPEAVIKGKTADISQTSEFGRYEWVMFRNIPPQFPDMNMVLGQYLGPSIGVGPTMMAKIMTLTLNGFAVPCLTLCGLIPSKRESPKCIEPRRKIDADIEIKLGPKATVNIFDAIDELPLE